MFRQTRPFILTALLCVITLLGGCATYQHVPEGYTGSTASIHDTSTYETSSKGQIFYVNTIDDNTVKNARSATAQASYGKGFRLTTATVTRDVRTVPIRLNIVGTHVTAAPIHEFASRAIGAFFTVSGDVTFTPEKNKNYYVRGSLSKEVASVWIEDGDSKLVSEKIIAN